jgi:hypothetical protein
LKRPTKEFPAYVLKRLVEEWACDDEIKFMGDWNEITEDFEDDDVYVVVVNEWYDNGRWKSQHDLVFLDKQDGKYYHYRYEKGLTESQHYYPLDEYKKYDSVECDEVTVERKERTIIETTWAYK